VLFCLVSNFIFVFVMCSGMLVQDPTRRNDVDAIFEQARQAGIKGMPPPLGGESSSSRSFTGTGRLLTGETISSAAPQEPVPIRVRHNIHLWNNGFSVDDGPLRYYDDPENAEFLEVIHFYMIFLNVLIYSKYPLFCKGRPGAVVKAVSLCHQVAGSKQPLRICEGKAFLALSLP
jgi:hypothetical protein